MINSKKYKNIIDNIKTVKNFIISFFDENINIGEVI